MAYMSALNLKGIPEKLYSMIKKSARDNRRSLNNEAIFRLEQAYGLRASDSSLSFTDAKDTEQIKKTRRNSVS